jgi:hypothetical protein
MKRKEMEYFRVQKFVPREKCGMSELIGAWFWNVVWLAVTACMHHKYSVNVIKNFFPIVD